jgi:hypothetical protein
VQVFDQEYRKCFEKLFWQRVRWLRLVLRPRRQLQRAVAVAAVMVAAAASTGAAAVSTAVASVAAGSVAVDFAAAGSAFTAADTLTMRTMVIMTVDTMMGDAIWFAGPSGRAMAYEFVASKSVLDFKKAPPFGGAFVLCPLPLRKVGARRRVTGMPI